ncbi:MAG: hypothetical protein R3E56_01165 [Burkholderiaceae bacterium]
MPTVKRNANVYLTGLIAGNALVAGFEALAFARGVEMTSPVVATWPLAFLVLLALWVIEDSKAHPEIQKPFDYGFLVFVFSLPYLPLISRSRGAAGFLWLIGWVFISWVVCSVVVYPLS